MSELHEIQKEKQLYVFHEPYGYSCLGFEVLDRRGRALAEELGVPWEEELGTREAYKHYQELIARGRNRHATTGWRSKSELTPQLIGLEGKRVEVETTYGEKRRFWVGRSTGWIPCHLEVSRRGSHGGGACEYEYKSVREVRK